MKEEDLWKMEPTNAMVESHEMLVLEDGRKVFAAYYPQIGGYHGLCWVIIGPAGCFDVLLAHDGEFPTKFPVDNFHHCVAEQFIQFGMLVKDAIEKEGFGA